MRRSGTETLPSPELQLSHMAAKFASQYKSAIDNPNRKPSRTEIT